MASIVWILIMAGVALLLALIIVLLKQEHKKNTNKPDYYSFFIMGIIWLISGIALAISTKNYSLFIMGIIFSVWGYSNKDKWKKNHKPWKSLTDHEKNIKLAAIIILGLGILIGIIAFYLMI